MMGYDVSGIELRLTLEALLHTAGTVIAGAPAGRDAAIPGTLPPATEAAGVAPPTMAT